MAPTLQNGDYVMTFSAPFHSARRFKAGKIYIINHSDLGLIIKRLKTETAQGRLIFEGDNHISNSGHILGGIEKARVKARAVLQISKKSVKLI